MHVGDLLLDGRDGLARVQTLRAGTRAVHDGLAAIQTERVVEVLETFLRQLVAGVLDPAIRLHQHGGAQVTIGIPPVRWARRRAASAQDALVHAIEFLAVRLRLQELAVGQVVGLGVLRLQPRFDRLVLVVEVGQVGDQVLDDEHVRQGVDLDRFGGLVDVAEARQRVRTVDVHGAAATDTLTARTAEGQGRIGLVLDLDQRIQHHRAALVQVDGVGRGEGLLLLLRIPTVDLKVPIRRLMVIIIIVMEDGPAATYLMLGLVEALLSTETLVTSTAGAADM